MSSGGKYGADHIDSLTALPAEQEQAYCQLVLLSLQR